MLHEAVGTDKEVLVERLKRSHVFPRCNEVSEAPASHGKELGESIQYKGIICELQNRVLLSLIDQPWYISSEIMGISPAT